MQNICIFDAISYCNWLSGKEGRKFVYSFSEKELKKDQTSLSNLIIDYSADGYRLPSEIEWDYACRAGTATKWVPGDQQQYLSNYINMYPMKTCTPCGEKLPNAWGLHDMQGNVWEFLWNVEKNVRVDRGGSYGDTAEDCKSDWIRRDVDFKRRATNHGFRIFLNDVLAD